MDILQLTIDPAPKAIDEFSAQEFRQLLDLNVVGYFLTCKVRGGLLFV